MDPGIYVEVIPAEIFGKEVGKHAYLIYRKPDGSTEVIRSGPEFQDLGLKLGVETGKSLDESKDRLEDGEMPGSRPSRKLDIPPDKLDESWSVMQDKAKEIKEAGISYRVDSEPEDFDQTSNSVVRAALDAIGYPVDEALPAGTSKDNLPGIQDDLSDELEEARRKREEYIGSGRTRHRDPDKIDKPDEKPDEPDKPLNPALDRSGSLQRPDDAKDDGQSSADGGVPPTGHGAADPGKEKATSPGEQRGSVGAKSDDQSEGDGDDLKYEAWWAAAKPWPRFTQVYDAGSPATKPNSVYFTREEADELMPGRKPRPQPQPNKPSTKLLMAGDPTQPSWGIHRGARIPSPDDF